MYPPSFRYARAKTLDQAERLFAASGDAAYLSGGMTLIPTMKLRLASPGDVIDLNAIPDLAFVRRNGEVLEIGACTRHADVAGSAEVQGTLPALAHLASVIGDPAVRHRGTLGGSIANNDPAADYPAAILALATFLAPSLTAAPAVHVDPLQDGEIVTSAAFRIPARAGYAKFPNPASRYAMVGVFVADFDGAVRVAVTGAGPCVFRVEEMENALAKDFSADTARRIEIPFEGLNADLHASAEYRAHLVSVMAARAVEAALG